MNIKFHKDGTLPDDRDIFVFGSNLSGRHGAGAALVARQKFGAIYGKGFGAQGNSWAIPTKDANLSTLQLEEIDAYVDQFFDQIEDAFNKNRLIFVTRIGCGLAGYKDSDIAPMFNDRLFLTSCIYSFAEEWRPFIEE